MREQEQKVTQESGEATSPPLPGDDTFARIAQLSRKGYQYLRNNQANEAIRCFHDILALEPANNYALVGLGDSYRKKDRYREASRYYQRCIELHGKNNYALFGLADCYRNQRQLNRAIEVWEDYLTLDNTNVTVLTRVADACRKVRNRDRSIELYNRVLELEPDNAYALIGLGHLHYDFREFQEALSWWERMRNLSGNHVDIRVLTSLGNCHRKLKTFAMGIPCFQEALDREQDNFYALFGLADCYRGMNLQSRSLPYWNRILAQDPDNHIILTRAGDAYRKDGDADKARSCYTRALSGTFDPWAHMGLALLDKEQGLWQQAVRQLELVLEHDSQIPRTYPEALECYINLGDDQGTRQVLERFGQLRGVPEPVMEQVRSLASRVSASLPA